MYKLDYAFNCGGLRTVGYVFVVLVCHIYYCKVTSASTDFVIIVINCCCFCVIAEMMEDSHFNSSYFWSPIPTVPGQVSLDKKSRICIFFRIDVKKKKLLLTTKRGLCSPVNQLKTVLSTDRLRMPCS